MQISMSRIRCRNLIDELDDHDDENVEARISTAPINGGACCEGETVAPAVLTLGSVICRRR